MAKFNIAITVGIQGPGAKQVTAALDDIGHRAKRTADIIDLSAKAVAGFFSARALVGGLRAVYQEVAQADRAMAQLRATIQSTAGAAGFSAGRLTEMAQALEAATGSAGTDIQAAQVRLLTYTNIQGEMFERAQMAALDMAQALGTDLAAAAETVGKALGAPTHAMGALAKQGFRFTEEQKKLIQGFEETGRVAEAQKIIMEELELAYGGSAKAFRDTLPGAIAVLQHSWGGLLESMGEGLGDALRPSIEELIVMLGDLQTSFPREELASIIRDLAEGFVVGARTAADAAALLAKNIDLIKAAVVGYLALRAPLAAAALAESLIAAAKAATLAKTSILGMNAALLASPIGVIAGLTAAAAFAVTRYSSAVEAAYDLEMRWVGQQAEREQWLRTLTGRTEELTEAERLLWSERVRGMRVELAQLEAEARLADQRAKEARRLHESLTPKGAGWLGGVVGGVSGAPSAGRVKELAAAAADAKGRHDELAHSFEELQRALVLLGMGIGKTREGMGGLSGDAKKLAEELADLIAELKRSADQNRELAGAYGLGDEHVQSIIRAHVLHNAYLKDVAKFGAAAAAALRALRAEEFDTAKLAEQAKKAWEGLAQASERAGEKFNDEFAAEVQRGLRQMEEDARAALKAINTAASKFMEAAVEEFRRREAERLDIARETEDYLAGPYGQALRDAERQQQDFERRVTDAVNRGVISAAEGQEAIAAGERELARIRAEIMAQQIADYAQMAGDLVQVFGGDSKGANAWGDFFGSLGGIMQNPSNPMAWMNTFIDLANLINQGSHGGIKWAASFGDDAGVFSQHAATDIAGFNAYIKQAKEISKRISEGLRDLVESVGGDLADIANFTIGERDSRFFVDFEGAARQWFDTVEEALAHAMVMALQESELLGLDEAVRTAISNLDPLLDAGELQEQLAFAFDYSRLGVDETALSLRDLAADAIKAARSATELGLSVGKIAEEFQRDAQSLRDDILGITKDPATRQRERAEAFNREVERLMSEYSQRIALYQLETAQLRESIALKLAEIKAAGALSEAERLALLADQERLKFLLREIAALSNLLATLPAPIDLGQLRPPKGGGASQKKQDRETLEDLLRQSALAAMGEYARGLAELQEKWKEAAELAHGNKDLLDQVNKARAEEIRLLGERAKREMIDPYLGGGDRQTELDEIRRQFDDLRKNAKELGLALWQVNQAERNRLQLLGLEAAASLGDPIAAAILQFKGMADTVRFIKENLDALSMSADDFARIVEGMQTRNFLDLADSMARYIEDEKLRAELAEMRFDMEKAAMLVQIEMAKTFGAINEEQYRRLLELWGMLPADLPAGGAEDFSEPKRYRDWWGEQVTETANELERLKEAFADAKDGIRRFLLDISTNQFGGVNPEEALRAAQEEWTRVLSMAQAGQLEGFQGVPEAGRGLIDALKAYSPALYATELPKIQDILRRLGAADTVQDDGLVWTERFTAQQAMTNDTLDRGFSDLSSHAARSNATQADMLEEFRQLRAEQAAMNSKLERITTQSAGQKVVGGRG